MRQRYYNSEIKRFVNQDILTGSIGNSQSLNRYSYVQGNPVSYTDPFGLSPLNGLFSGTMLVHTVCELLGWIPGPVGAIANVVDGLVYLLVDKDYKNAFYSLGTAVTFGAGKIVAAVGKGSKTALNIQRGCNAIGNGINFLQSAEGTVQMGGMMIDKYIVQGQPFDSSTAMEFLFLGANMFGATKSGSALATDVKDFGRMVKGSWTAKGTSTVGNAGQIIRENELFLPDEYYQKLDNNIANAIAARDVEIARIQSLSKTQQSNIATVVAGVDVRTGDTYVGVKNSRVYKGNATCAEDIVFRGLGGNSNANIIMTPAIRPRSNETIPVCIRCQTKYPQNQFVKGTTFQ